MASLTTKRRLLREPLAELVALLHPRLPRPVRTSWFTMAVLRRMRNLSWPASAQKGDAPRRFRRT